MGQFEKKTQIPGRAFALNNATSPNLTLPVFCLFFGRLLPRCSLSATCARRRNCVRAFTRLLSRVISALFLALFLRYFALKHASFALSAALAFRPASERP